MPSQRVLHIIGKMDRAGAETMLINLYRHIDRELIQFDFITFTDEEGDYDAEITQMGGRIIPIVAKNPIERMLKLQKFLKQHPEYKIVHAHTLLSNAFHLLAAKSAGVKHRISHSHNTSNGRSNTIKKLYEKWSLIINRQLSTQRIACGKLAAQYLFGTTKEVMILPNAVDIDAMTAIASRSTEYIDNNFENNGIKIIQVGRFNEVKNHSFSLKIAKELEQRAVEFTMYFIGQGPLENELHQEVEKEALEHRIKFLGVRSDITELMASADYMIMPSLHEGFPVVLVESQATGLKSIVSDQISQEVELGLGLIEFLPLNSEKDWIDRLLNSKKMKKDKDVIVNSLKKQGFDAGTNAQKLSEFYKSL